MEGEMIHGSLPVGFKDGKRGGVGQGKGRHIEGQECQIDYEKYPEFHLWMRVGICPCHEHRQGRREMAGPEQVSRRHEAVGHMAHQGGGDEGDYPHGGIKPLYILAKTSRPEQLPEAGKIASPHGKLEKIEQ